MTAQEPDIIFYQNERYLLYSNPLEGYFKLHAPRPPFQMTKTSNWRGYVATWEIVDKHIYLKTLDGMLSGMQPITLKNLFPELSDKIFANWVTDVLIIPKGKILQYHHMGYMSIYEHEIHLKFEKGILIDQKIVDNTKKDLNAMMQPLKPPEPPKL